MQQTLQDLRKFIKNRFTPCIYCFATHESLNTQPNIPQTIINCWSQIMNRYQNNIRVIFPFSLPSFRYLNLELQNPRLFNKNSQPYDFFKKEPNLSHVYS